MDVFDEMRAVERPRFFDGQQLFASDLDGIVGFHRAMRWLHNRSLHQPGIGNGFAVAGRRGEREVRIQPGYAIDAEGREIVLLDTHVEQVPPVASESGGAPVFFDLAVSYPADDDLEEAETREGVCLDRGAVRLRERPVFCWIRLQRDVAGTLRPRSEADALAIQAATRIVLARVQVRQCRLDADLVIAIRRTARPPQPPNIVCGACGAMPWEPWVESIAGGDDMPVGLRAPVSTTAGKFRVTPCYAARVCGPRPLEVTTAGQVNGGSRTVIVFDRAVYVVGAGAAGFEAFVPVEAQFDVVDTEVLDALLPVARKRWSVSWLGIAE
jgi:hypothetical protein